MGFANSKEMSHKSIAHTPANSIVSQHLNTSCQGIMVLELGKHWHSKHKQYHVNAMCSGASLLLILQWLGAL